MDIERVIRQLSALNALSRGNSLQVRDLVAALGRMTEMAARTLNVERVSIWRYNKAHSAIYCVELYELSAQRHSSGTELLIKDYPAYFKALAASEIIAADDAHRDARTCEFSERYLRPLGITSMMDVPIHVAGRLDGVLCHEHVGAARQWRPDEQIFAVATANLVSLVIGQWERRRAEEALRESQERFKAFMDSGLAVAFMKDEDGRMVYVNQPFERFFKLTRSEWLGKSDFELWPQETAQKLRENDLAVIAGGVPVELMETIPAPDGAPHHLLVFKFPFTDVSGKRFLGGMAVDITERKQLEEQLRQSQKMEAVGKLAGGVAHDFNNLLTIITGYSQLLMDRVGHDSPLHGNLMEIKRAGDRASSLTQQLLAFSRRQVLKPKVLDLNAVVTGLEGMLQRLVGEDIQVVTALDPELGPVKADPGQIEQVIMNLVVNARDAMPQGGRLTIETANVEMSTGSGHGESLKEPARYAMLAVSDTGCGMDAQTQTRIFEPFFTTKEVGKGTGLGLSTVYGIVEQSGGHIDVASEVGRGTIFKIHLPRVDDAVAERVADTVSDKLPRGTETVLIVEDEPGVRALARDTLRRHGYFVLEARHGIEALVIGSQHPGSIHLLMADVVMPQMNGREVAER
ncbi:MAG TPA: ATP-binding protein, partial [Nitrospiraceae bacterium]|nr:ATP-binding protein [Nitrospiraceae bacterium]